MVASIIGKIVFTVLDFVLLKYQLVAAMVLSVAPNIRNNYKDLTLLTFHSSKVFTALYFKQLVIYRDKEK